MLQRRIHEFSRAGGDSNAECFSFLAPPRIISSASSDGTEELSSALLALGPARDSSIGTNETSNESLTFDLSCLQDMSLDLILREDPRFTKLGVPDIVKMNQLQNLIHDSLIATEHVQSCAIIRRKDSTLRASSVGFSLNHNQISTLLDCFKHPAHTRDEGFQFDDRQYQCVRADKNSIYAKSNKLGLILVRTSTLLIMATYTQNMYPSVCVEAVEKLADYFKEKGK